MIHASQNVLELPLLQRAELAMESAMNKLIEEHAQAGLPLYIWRDGKVVAVPAEDLRAKSRS